MQFFGTNELYTLIGGTWAASSGNAELAFDEDSRFFWQSQGESSVGNSVFLTRTLPFPETISRIVILDTNISDLAVSMTVTSGSLSFGTTLQRIYGGMKSVVIPLNSPVTISSLTITGSNTIFLGEEKRVGKAYAFVPLGQLKFFDDISPRIKRLQKVSQLYSGKTNVINIGSYYTFELALKAHYSQDENDIITLLRNRRQEVWLWINDNNQDWIYMDQRPYRFQDFFKVAVTGDDSLKFFDNRFYSGVDDRITFSEVA